jgi:hypothetical protein
VHSWLRGEKAKYPARTNTGMAMNTPMTGRRTIPTTVIPKAISISAMAMAILAGRSITQSIFFMNNLLCRGADTLFFQMINLQPRGAAHRASLIAALLANKTVCTSIFLVLHCRLGNVNFAGPSRNRFPTHYRSSFIRAYGGWLPKNADFARFQGHTQRS